MHKAYGHTSLTYNRPAIAPLGECKSNWEVMGLLATALGFDEPHLHQTADEVIDEVLTATAKGNPFLRGVTLARVRAEGAVPLAVEDTPFADGRFPTPSGKVELYSERMAQSGDDPLPGGAWDGEEEKAAMVLLTPASHHFVSSSLASQPGLLRGVGEPFVEINPIDAAARRVADGDAVVIENDRGAVQLRAVVTDAVRPGVLASPKGRWAKLSGGRNVNWTTPDALGDLAGQSTFQSNCVWLRRADDP